MIHLPKTSTCPSLGHATKLLCVAASLCCGQVSAATLPTLTSMAAQTAIQQTAPTHQEEKHATSSPQRTLPHVWRNAVLLTVVLASSKLSLLVVNYEQCLGMFQGPLFSVNSWLGSFVIGLVPMLAACLTTWLVVDTDASNEPYAMLKATIVFTIMHCLPFVLLGVALHLRWIPKELVEKGMNRRSNYTLTLKNWGYFYLCQVCIVWIMDLVTICFNHYTRQAESKSETKLAPPSEAS